MLDWLELSVPFNAPKNYTFWANRPKTVCRKQPYLKQMDCRPELQVIVFEGRPAGIRREDDFKVQFIGAGSLTADDFYYQVGHLFSLNHQAINRLKVMRVDFAVDTLAPVQWFRENCHVKGKQLYREMRLMEESTKRGYTTIILGKRPDLFRIYDKVEEIKHRTGELWYMGRISGKPEPTVTRVERQCSGGGVPTGLRTLGNLLNNASKFDPFTPIRFEKGAVLADTQKWKDRKWLMCMGLKFAVRELGMPVVRARLNRKGNTSRYFKLYSGLLRSVMAGPSNASLKKAYQNSTIFQLNQPVNGRHPQGGLLMDL